MNRVLVGVMLLVGAYYDKKRNQIPNLLCLGSMAAGTYYFLLFGGMKEGITHFLWAIGLLVCFFPLWLMKGVGGGDVKLLMAVGFLLGENCISFLLCAGICVGLHGFFLLLRRKNYRHRIGLLVQYVMACYRENQWKPYPFNPETDCEEGGIRISYGFLAGHILAMLLRMYH